MSEIDQHVVTVTYTVMDDGIWLTCGCGWAWNIGYSPRIPQVVSAWQVHLSEVMSRSLRVMMGDDEHPS
jgi:hypothetical protein